MSDSVCVLCGTPWGQEFPFTNVCENPDCRGFCTWGEEKGGSPSSWDVDRDGKWTPKPPPNRGD